MSDVSLEAARRRTFAIVSHPDAGKTTLTEKLLLFGGAIQMAGSVKGRKAARHATSDWMALEKERGISVTSSVMQFPYEDRIVNLLDTPGHADFGEDTYRVLTAVDSALMVIDVAWRAALRPFTEPAIWIAPPNRSSFSVSVVLPASGCETIAKVRRRAASVETSDMARVRGARATARRGGRGL